MSHVSYIDDHSLPVSILIVTVHSTFVVEDIEATLADINAAFATMDASFYCINILEELDISIDDVSILMTYFEDGGILTNPYLKGIVLVNARGMVRVLKAFVKRQTPYIGPLDEAATVEGARQLIAGWIRGQ